MATGDRAGVARRRRRPAAARRGQCARSQARALQQVLRGFASLRSHRGCATTRLGEAFARALEVASSGSVEPVLPAAAPVAETAVVHASSLACLPVQRSAPLPAAVDSPPGRIEAVPGVLDAPLPDVRPDAAPRDALQPFRVAQNFKIGQDPTASSARDAPLPDVRPAAAPRDALQPFRVAQSCQKDQDPCELYTYTVGTTGVTKATGGTLHDIDRKVLADFQRHVRRRFRTWKCAWTEGFGCLSADDSETIERAEFCAAPLFDDFEESRFHVWSLLDPLGVGEISFKTLRDVSTKWGS